MKDLEKKRPIGTRSRWGELEVRRELTMLPFFGRREGFVTFTLAFLTRLQP